MSRQDEIQNIKRLVKNHQRRLQALEERKALYGIDTPLAILTEIEDTQAEIEKLEAQLQELEQRPGDLAEKTEPATAPERLATGAGSKGGTPWLWIGSGAIVAAIIIGLVIFIILNDRGAETNNGSQTVETPTPTPTNIPADTPEPPPTNPPPGTPEPTATNTPEPLSTPALKLPENGASFTANQEVTFEWEGDELANDQWYVFIISHQGCIEDPDFPGCSDVHWLAGRGQKSFATPMPDWFIKEGQPQSVIEWWVVVSTREDPNFQSPNHQPTATVVKSDVRNFILNR
ncbi:MAG: hypothetical protein JXM69_21075 [Anaerolineae bacterium]|nr:hypothetical protein [Anaerolineae bacterium]